jgi:hypothetical protein
MPDPKNWPQGTRAPASATTPAPAPAPAPAAAPVAAAPVAPVAPVAEDSEPMARTDEDIQRDLEALFAIRDAALAEAAQRAGSRPEEPDFQPTQPAEDRPPRR